MAMFTQPNPSAHAAMSRAAAYRSAMTVFAMGGFRKSNRSAKSISASSLGACGREDACGGHGGETVVVAEIAQLDAPELAVHGGRRPHRPDPHGLKVADVQGAQRGPRCERQRGFLGHQGDQA